MWEKVKYYLCVIGDGVAKFLYGLYECMPIFGAEGVNIIRQLVSDGYIDHWIFMWVLLPWIMAFVAWHDRKKSQKEHEEEIESLKEYYKDAMERQRQELFRIHNR